MEKILVIDDEAPMIKGLLRGMEFELVFAVSEEQAIAILETQRISAVLMDGNLDPYSDVWGADVVRRLRSAGYTLPICMFSSDDELNADGKNAGADSSFRKKWSDKDLLKKLEKHLRTLVRTVP